MMGDCLLEAYQELRQRILIPNFKILDEQRIQCKICGSILSRPTKENWPKVDLANLTCPRCNPSNLPQG